MPRKINFVLSGELLPVETQPLLRTDYKLNLVRRSREIRDSAPATHSCGGKSTNFGTRRND